MEQSIEGRIRQANGRLKQAKCRIRIQQIGNRLYLRGTLPPRPDEPEGPARQQRLSLGAAATPAGLKQAESEARLISAQLDCGAFDWGPYIPIAPPEMATDWAQKFEVEYFARRARTEKTERTWRTDYAVVLRRLPDKPLTPELLRQMVLETEPDTKTRRRTCMVLQALARLAGVDVDLRPYRGGYSASEVDPRDLPTDEQIIERWQGIPAREWRWVYGMLATYGLRPSEIFSLDLARYGGEILHVSDGKTGARDVWPLYPEWVELFRLTERCVPAAAGKDLGQRVTQYFRRRGLGKPYDLRHCWARRSILFRLDVRLAAAQMGHSVEVHQKSYCRWIKPETHRRAWELAASHPDRPRSPHMSPSA